MEINRFKLDNGLKVVHIPFTATAMVAVNMLYSVGSRRESPELTGMAHLFEHLMFGGSANIPDFDTVLSAAGGYSNAWTSQDFTNFYDVLPACNLPTALRLEADRMQALAFSPQSLEVQRHVVIEEFKQVCLNRPYGDLSHHLQKLAYTHHPYRWPVIGKDFSHIEKVTLSDVRSWHARFYGPGNALLVICGNVSLEDARRSVELYFGSIPPRSVPVEEVVSEPLPEAPRRLELSGNVPHTLLTIAYPMAPYGHPDYFAADLISDILANGNSSRFFRELLLGTDMFNSVDASIQGTEQPGLFLIQAALRSNGEEAERRAIEAIESQLSALVRGSVAPREIARCVNRIESNRTFSNLTPQPLALTVALAEAHGEEPEAFIAPYRAITPESLSATAAELFSPHRRILVSYRPA